MQDDKLVEYHTQYLTRVDLLWDISFSIKSPRPAWSGLMQMINKIGNRAPRKVLHVILTHVGHDITCIYSTMMYVSEHVARNNVTHSLTLTSHYGSWLKIWRLSYPNELPWSNRSPNVWMLELLEQSMQVILSHISAVAMQLSEQFEDIVWLVQPTTCSSYQISLGLSCQKHHRTAVH